MSLKKDEAIHSILADFELLSNLVLKQLDMAEKIVTEGSIKIPHSLLDKIQKNEEEIDKKEVKLSDQVINTIVLYQPVASDLRRIMSCYRIIISLERIGDHVINIANFISKLKSQEVFDQLQEVIHNMIIQSNRMVKESLLSFINDDRELAIWTLKNKMALEEINNKLLKKLLGKKRTEESNKKFLMSIITIKEMMSDIERIADHAINVAEASIYYIDGKDIRHLKIPE